MIINGNIKVIVLPALIGYKSNKCRKQKVINNKVKASTIFLLLLYDFSKPIIKIIKNRKINPLSETPLKKINNAKTKLLTSSITEFQGKTETKIFSVFFIKNF